MKQPKPAQLLITLFLPPSLLNYLGAQLFLTCSIIWEGVYLLVTSALCSDYFPGFALRSFGYE